MRYLVPLLGSALVLLPLAVAISYGLRRRMAARARWKPVIRVSSKGSVRIDIERRGCRSLAVGMLHTSHSDFDTLLEETRIEALLEADRLNEVGAL